MRLRVTTDSYTMCGSGEGAGLIDSDVVFDRLGFPYLPGRRIKGLLRESAQEVLEMLGKDATFTGLLNSLFGKGGFKPGNIRVPNLHPPDYKNVSAYAALMLKDRTMALLSKAGISAAHTEIREQTALADDGVADESSLRITRLLRPGLSFEAEINPLPQPEEALLFLAGHNLKRMGSRRNRGQGKIACSLDGNFTSVNDAIAALSSSPTALCGTRENQPLSANMALNKLPYIVTVTSPLVLSKPIGDENTVSTDNYLSGNAIRGVLAAKIMAELGLTKKNAHRDKTFYNLLLSDESPLLITTAFPCEDKVVFCPAPMVLHTDKSNGESVYNLLKCEEDVDAKYRRELLSLSSNGIASSGVDKTLFFHMNRGSNRVQGKSNEGGIFFYESIDPGQKFRGWITGPETSLNDLINLVGNRFDVSIGRSRSAQYGDAEINFEKDQDCSYEGEEAFGGDQEFLLNALSPIILYNEFGIAEVGTCRLKAWLDAFFGVPVEVPDAFARLTTADSFVGVWGMRSPRDVAYEEGSTFVVRVEGLDQETLSDKVAELLNKGIGERTEAGFGQVRILRLQDASYWKTSSSQANTIDYPTQMPPQLRKIVIEILRDEIRRRTMEKGMMAAKGWSKPLTNHQIGRLEQMLTGMGRSAFAEALGELRPTAEKQLENCKNSARVPLLEKLKEFDGDVIREVDNLLGNLRAIMSKAELQAEDVADRNALARDYWVSLLRKMRKDNRKRRNL